MPSKVNQTQKSQFFISYSRSDRLAVDQLVKDLRHIGYNLWMDVDVRGIEAGEDWQQELREQMTESSAVIACVSPDFLDSPYCKDEIDQAIEEKKPIFPVIIRRLDVGQSLDDMNIGHVQFVDLTQYYEQAFKRLVVGMPSPQFRRQRLVRRYGIVSLAVFVLVLFLAGFTLTRLRQNTLSPTLSPSTNNTGSEISQPAELAMPAGFNVVVAGFGFQQNDGKVVESTIANNISDTIYAELKQLPEIDNIRSWRDPGVEHILQAEPADQEAQAAKIAHDLNADIVIFALVKIENLYTEIEPQYFIAAEFAALEPEMIGVDSFGQTISFLSGSEDVGRNILSKRTASLRLFLSGLALYLQGEFTESRLKFAEAISLGESGMESLYILAGNAAMREPDVPTALSFYSAVLPKRPEYPRALAGRGLAIFRLATNQYDTEKTPFDPDLKLADNTQCANFSDELPESVQLKAELAEICYAEARASTEQPSLADVDAKISFDLGQLTAWLSLINYSDRWDESQTYMQTVVDLYNSADKARQARIQILAAQAYAYLGLRLITVDSFNIESLEQAKSYYQTAIDLLESDVSRNYNAQWIEDYNKRIVSIDSVIKALSPDQ